MAKMPAFMKMARLNRPEGRRGDRQTAQAVWGVALKARVERLNQRFTNIGPGAQTINVQATDTDGNTTTPNRQLNTP